MAENENDMQPAQAYWKANIRLIIILLAIWAFVSYVCGIILAPVLSGIYLGQLPLGFWFAQQGSMITFVILIFVYSYLMDKIDQEFDVHE
jgi:putative solute:sodium symporter small subunit